MPKDCQIVRHVGRLLQEEEKKALMLQGNIFQETSLQTVKFADILQRNAVSSQQIVKKIFHSREGLHAGRIIKLHILWKRHETGIDCDTIGIALAED